MKRKLLALFFSCAISLTIWGESMNEPLNLMPVPESVVTQQGRFALSRTFTVGVAGFAGPRLRGAADRFLRRLDGRTGLFIAQETVGTWGAKERAGLMISCLREGKLRLGEDESYRLDVKPEGIDLSAPTDLGVLHGLETLLQLLTADRNGYYVPCARIEDRPRFPWRGVLFDVCRHFLPLEVIKRNLDGMAMVKMNVLHWHLSENQGFRIECKTFPKLHQLGSDGLYYTQDEVRGLIAYAADRGIRVVPEFDIPGHSTSWLVGYPELASAPGPYGIERGYGIKDPTFNPTLKQTYKFFDRFFAEMAALFPDVYMHIGGDEVNGKQWNDNPKIQEFMKKNGLKDNHALQAYFNRKIFRILE